MTIHFPTHEATGERHDRELQSIVGRQGLAVQVGPDGHVQTKSPLEFRPGRWLAKVYREGGKRVIETVLTLLALPIVLPLIAIFALLIALDGRNPFYSQVRVGQGGRTFRMWKLRTMVHNADDLLEKYLASNPDAMAEWTSTQKLKRDPRVTLVGRFLRKVSLDELPQLLNVLNGTMSLVGPRPMMLSQRDSYNGTAYFHLKPGITGLWQISDRNECAFVGRVRYDEAYDRLLSPIVDFRILIGTVGVVVRGTGY